LPTWFTPIAWETGMKRQGMVFVFKEKVAYN